MLRRDGGEVDLLFYLETLEKRVESLEKQVRLICEEEYEE
jgi:hypothetical protein